MNIGIFSDSLSLPRPLDERDPIFYAEVYSSLVAAELRKFGMEVNIENFGKRNRTTADELDPWLEDIAYRDFDVIIVHVGINDCVPRLISKRMNKWIKSLSPRLQTNVVRLFKVLETLHLIKRKVSKAYVSLGKFSRNIKEWLAKLKGTEKVIFIGIAPPGNFLKKKNQNIEAVVFKYNEAIKKIALDNNCRFISISQDEYLYYDGIHLNKEGHKFIANNILKELL